MIFKQLFDPLTFTFTYIIASEYNGQAFVIDPVAQCSKRDNKLIHELNLDVKYILETHLPSDHISGISLMKEAFPNSLTVSPVAERGDLLAESEHNITIGGISLEIINTPGHTANCVSYYINGKVFTGDSLLIRSCGIIDKDGDPELLYQSVTEKLFNLPDHILIFPGHNYQGFLCSHIKEEKLFNPLFSCKKEQFIDLLSNYKAVNNRQDVQIKENYFSLLGEPPIFEPAMTHI